MLTRRTDIWWVGIEARAVILELFTADEQAPSNDAQDSIFLHRQISLRQLGQELCFGVRGGS